jgi:hypothetical protein
MAASVRRWGLAGLAATVGGLLLVCGLAVAVADAQLRSEAATAATTFTAAQRAQLDEMGLYESVAVDALYVRRSLILQNLAWGGPMPERSFELLELDDGNVSMSWGTGADGINVSSWGGGWQVKPVGIFAFTGLTLTIGSLFIVAGRWESQHPLD